MGRLAIPMRGSSWEMGSPTAMPRVVKTRSATVATAELSGEAVATVTTVATVATRAGTAEKQATVAARGAPASRMAAVVAMVAEPGASVRVAMGATEAMGATALPRPQS